MNAISINPIGELTQRKSLLLIQAQFQQALGQQPEAARLFLEAAVLEERLAQAYQQTGQAEDAAISLFSAASCYKQAARPKEALARAEAALALTLNEGFTAEIRSFLSECQRPGSLTAQRTLRGVVRNGAVYPVEIGVLTEGELVTITTV